MLLLWHPLPDIQCCETNTALAAHDVREHRGTSSRQRSALAECLSVDVGVIAAQDVYCNSEKLNKVSIRGSGILWGLEDQIFREVGGFSNPADKRPKQTLW